MKNSYTDWNLPKIYHALKLQTIIWFIWREEQLWINKKKQVVFWVWYHCCGSRALNRRIGGRSRSHKTCACLIETEKLLQCSELNSFFLIIITCSSYLLSCFIKTILHLFRFIQMEKNNFGNESDWIFKKCSTQQAAEAKGQRNIWWLGLIFDAVLRTLWRPWIWKNSSGVRALQSAQSASLLASSWQCPSTLRWAGRTKISATFRRSKRPGCGSRSHRTLTVDGKFGCCNEW